MENINNTHIIMLSISLLTAIYLGWLLTETKYRIADKHPLLNRKPFSCRPCLTFHFGWILSGIVALSTKQTSDFVIGTAISLFIWCILEIKNRRKVDK